MEFHKYSENYILIGFKIYFKVIQSTLRGILYTEIKDHGNLFLIIPNYGINNGHSIRKHLNQKSVHFSSLTRILTKLRPKLINKTMLSCTPSVENNICKF